MKRYQKLIQDAAKDSSFAQLAIAIEAPSTSVHEWATHSYKVPQYKSLEKIAHYFSVPVPTLLMEVGEAVSPDDQIIEALCWMDGEQKSRVVEFINTLQHVR